MNRRRRVFLLFGGAPRSAAFQCEIPTCTQDGWTMRVCNDGPTLQCYTPRSSDECGLSPCTHEGDPVCLEPGTCHTFSEPWGPCGYYPGETSVAVTEGIVGSKVRLVACRIHC